MFSHKVISGVFLTLCIIFILTIGALVFIARERSNDIINELAIDRIMASRKGFNDYLLNLSNTAMQRGAILARQDELIRAIREYERSGLVLDGENTDFPQYETIKGLMDNFQYGFDFLSVTDKNGIALARTDSGEREYPLPQNGYSLMANPDVQMVMETGKPVAALTFMLDNTSLVASSLYPVYDGDTLIGNITCLYDLTNPRYINAYKAQSGSEVAIFLGHEEFISTFSYGENPVRLQAHSDVIEAIFENGEDSYISFTQIGDTMYGTIFYPFVYHGEIVGMLFAGVDIHSALAIRTETDMLIIFVTSLFLLIALVFIMVIQRTNKMIGRQIALQSIMTSISQSFLTDEDVSTLITKAFGLLGPQMNVAQILMHRPKQDDGSTYFCANEWIDPAFKLPSRIGEEFTVSDELHEFINAMAGSDTPYISSDERDIDIKKIVEPYRVNFKRYISTAVLHNGRIYAIVDFSRAKERGKWSRDDINAALYITSIMTGAIRKSIAEEELVLAKEVAERSSQYKSAFLANVSHEIRTPMNAILGITEIYMQDPASQKNIEEGLGIIYDSGNLLLGIINDILDLSKIEAGKMDINPVKYDMPSLISDVIQICRLRYGSKPIELALDIDKQTPLNLFGDELRIRQVLNNILSNAFKYTDSGKIEMSVSAQPQSASLDSSSPPEDFEPFPRKDIPRRARRGSDAVQASFDEELVLIFRVKDTGQGMTADQLERLFDEFTRFNTDANLTTVGTGLGMSITKHLLELMGGDIKVESALGKGTSVTVYIPQKRTDEAVCGPQLSEKLNSFNFYSMTATRRSQVVCEFMPYGSVLVVDDVDSNLYVSKGMLIPYGLKVDTASSGFEAIDYVSSGRDYDVIFMDHMMPKMDGIETTRNLREMGYKGYIIALTANALIGQAEIFLKNGFDSYISKPVDTRELNAVLNEYIRDKKPPEVVNAAREEAREAELFKSLESAGEPPAKSPMDEVRGHFINDTKKAIDILTKQHKEIAAGKKADIDAYRISVHGMKSALRLVGEKSASEFAYMLEQAALTGDTDTISAKTPQFIDELIAIVSRTR